MIFVENIITIQQRHCFSLQYCENGSVAIAAGIIQFHSQSARQKSV